MGFRSASSNKIDDGTGTVVVTKPAGVVDGDFLIAAATCPGTVTITAPAGWVLLAPKQEYSSATLLAVYGKYASSEPASYSWTFSGTDGGCVGIVAYKDVRPVFCSILGSAVYYTGLGVSTVDMVSANATSDDLILVAAFFANGGGSGAVVTWTPPASMAERVDVGEALTNNRTALLIADEQLTATGATGIRTATMSRSTNRPAAISILLAPITNYYNKAYKPLTSLDDGEKRPMPSGSGLYAATTSLVRFGNEATNKYGVFLRFPSVDIPKGKTILAARINWPAQTTLATATCKAIYYAVAADNQVQLAEADWAGYDALPVTVGVQDDNVPSQLVNNSYASVDIAACIQAVVNRSGWSSGNALVILIKDNTSSSGANRKAYTVDTGHTALPLLEVKYSVGLSAKRPMLGVGI